MARYTPRHAPRHAAPRQRPVTRAVRTVVGRPVLTTGLLAVAISGAAAATSFGQDNANADPVAMMIDGTASSLGGDEARSLLSDDARVSADRSSLNAQKSAVAAKNAEVERVAAAALAKQRRDADARAARAAERQRVFDNAQKDPKAAARLLLPEYGFSDAQWPCLDQLWIGESDWRWWVANPSSGAYGIPQSLPGDKMASVAPDWKTNPVTQIKWGLDYIKRSYGTPCNALDTWNSRSPHWY